MSEGENDSHRERALYFRRGVDDVRLTQSVMTEPDYEEPVRLQEFRAQVDEIIR